MLARSSLPWFWLALVLLAGALYLFGLDSPYAPTNGDEMVYIHIARMTAESGHWLPLQSELVGTRNTKPPMLIWQAMVAGGWGDHWNLFVLRLPAVVYTLLTTAGVALLAFGSGPVRGFAVVHCLGILTSMFSAVMVSRGLVNLVYGSRRRVAKLSV